MQAPSQQEVLSSVDGATADALDATHENEALLEKASKARRSDG